MRMMKIAVPLVLAATLGVSALALADGHGKGDALAEADAQVLDLEKMCAETAGARSARHVEKTLYERLGKEDGILMLIKELVRLHKENEAIAHLFKGLDDDLVAKRVTDFMVSGTGGPDIYRNRPTLPDSHRHMKLTNADFMTAGADVIQAMQNLHYGQDEIDELVCVLVSLRPMVVLDEGVHERASR